MSGGFCRQRLKQIEMEGNARKMRAFN